MTPLNGKEAQAAGYVKDTGKDWTVFGLDYAYTSHNSNPPQ